MDSFTYLSKVTELLQKIHTTQTASIAKAAQVKAKAIIDGRLLHYFGCGHSLMLCEEVFFRAGGLACTNPIFDPGLMVQHGAVKSSYMEKQENYAQQVLDQYPLEKGDVITIISTSGRNPVPVDAALYARAKGLTVIGITSGEYQAASSRHSSGAKLHDVCDILIDNQVPYGDTLLDFGSFAAVPGSTFASAFIINAVVAETIKDLVDAGHRPPVLISGNVDGSAQHNEQILASYRKRVKHL